MIINLYRRGRVFCRERLDIPLSAARVWGRLRDVAVYGSHEQFHASFQIEGGVARHGANLILTHRYGGFEVRRVGRIVRWREGTAYSFSDLSRRGPRRGFPHVFSFDLHPIAENRTRVEIRITGLWTARWIPRPLARLWLFWVFQRVCSVTRNKLLLIAMNYPSPFQSEND